MNETRERATSPGTLVAGIVLIVFGVLFLLDRADVTDFGDVVRRYWPMFVIGSGVMKISRGEIWNGLWLLAVGSWLQLVTLHLFGLTYGSSWPLLLIVLGGGMMLRALIGTTGRHTGASQENRHES